MADGKTNAPLGEQISDEHDPAAARQPGPRIQTNLLPGQDFPVRLAWAFYGLMVAVALVWRGLWDGDVPWSAPGVAPLALPIRLAAGVGVGLAGVVLSRWWIARSERGARLSDELARMLGPMGLGTAWGLALASGFGEELLFRGAAQPALGLWIASALFAAVHYLPNPGLWIWMLYALGAGLVLGGLFQCTGDVVAPVTAHAVLNGVNLGWLGRRNRERLAGRGSPTSRDP